MPPRRNENENQPDPTPTDPAGAWELDKRYGQRLDHAFAIGERFMLLAGKIDPDVVPTDFGDAEHASLLVQKLDGDGVPTGIPFKVGTLASAIVEKIKALADGDLPAVVAIEVVTSKRFKKPALVLSYVGSTNTADVAAEFGLDAGQVDKMLDTARPTSERIGF